MIRVGCGRKIELMKYKVAVVGDASTDHFLILDASDAGLTVNGKSPEKELCLKYGEKTSIESSLDFFGGGALNVAVALRNFSFDVSLSTIVGADFEGKEIVSFLNDEGIELDNLIVKGATNQSFILVYEKERTILSYHNKRDYSSVKIPACDILYFASAGQGSEELVNNIRSKVHSGSRLIFNPGSFEISSFDLFKPLCAISTIFVINRDEAREIIEDTPDIKVQLDKILRFGTKVAVISDQKNGAYFGTAEGFFHMNAAVANVKDPTGAGDAFSSGLVAGLANGKSLEESAKWGMHNSAKVIEDYGANSLLLDVDEIERKTKNDKVLKFSKL